MGSLGKSVSGIVACKTASQIPEEAFEKLDSLAYKIENGLIKLISSLQMKKENNDWIDTMSVKDINISYSDSQ